MKTRVVFAALLALGCFAVKAQSPLAIDVQPERGELEIRFKGQHSPIPDP